MCQILQSQLTTLSTFCLQAPKPAAYIGQMDESAQFYSNKVLKEFKEYVCSIYVKTIMFNMLYVISFLFVCCLSLAVLLEINKNKTIYNKVDLHKNLKVIMKISTLNLF